MKKQIALLMFLFGTFAYGCAMCQMSVPQVSVYTKIYDKKDHTAFDVTWKFHKTFTTMLKAYDENGDGIFDDLDREAILKSIVIYIAPLNYLAEVQYVPKDSEFKNHFLKPTITNAGSVDFEKGALVF